MCSLPKETVTSGQQGTPRLDLFVSCCPRPETDTGPVSGELAEWKMLIQNKDQTVRSWPIEMSWVPGPRRQRGGRSHRLSQT